MAASGLRISVFNSAELQGVILMLRGLDRELAKQLRKAIKSMADPVWRDEMAQHASTRLESTVLARTARVAVSNQNVTLKAAQVGRTLKGGFDPKADYHSAEFGVGPDTVEKVTARSRRGKSYSYRRRALHAPLRARNAKGFVFYPSIAAIVPRIGSLTVQTAVRTFHEQLEKGAGNG
jgi:hypothetical protein